MKDQTKKLYNDCLRDLAVDIRFSRRQLAQHNCKGYCRQCEPEAKYLNENLRNFRKFWPRRHNPQLDSWGMPRQNVST